MKLDRNYRILYALLWPFFALCHPVHAIGRENIPEGAAVICPNHSTWGDPFYVVFAFRRPYIMRAMAKIQLMRLPVIGGILRAVGVFGVDRGAADLKAAKTAMKYLRDGYKLLMFPEGTRVEEGENVEAKAGAAMFSTRTGAPLLPVYIQPKKRWFRPTKVVIGTPYHPQVAGRRATAEELHQIAQELMERIHALKEQAE